MLGGMAIYLNAKLVRVEKEINDYQVKLLEANKKFDEINEAYGNAVSNKYCTPCHRKYTTDNYLSGVVERVGDEYFALYITRQDSLIAAKNDYAVRAKSFYGNMANVHNFKLSKNDLKAITAYFR